MFKPSLKIASIALGIALSFGALSGAQAADSGRRGHDGRSFSHQHQDRHAQHARHHHHRSNHSQHGNHDRAHLR